MSGPGRRSRPGLSRRQLLEAGLRTGGGLALGSTLGCDVLQQTLLPGVAPPAPEPAGPDPVPAGETIGAVRHVLNRLSFGPRPGDRARVRSLGADEDEAAAAYVEQQLHPEPIDDPWGEWAVRRLETLRQPLGELFEYQPRLLLSELTRGAILRAVYSRRQLFEVMVHFWSDHFNIDVSKGDCRWLKAADDREVVRRHALGRFGELLRASALSPAMLWYLDGRVNKKARPADRPNENYARELLELHTLGVDGGYTQRDVMEVARCLTGWTVRSEEAFGKGRVEFRPGLHDDGAKEVLGHRIDPGGGEEDLDRVLEIAAHHPATARHLAAKLCRRFIGEPDPDGVGGADSAERSDPDDVYRSAVAAVAGEFEATGGDLRPTLRALFATPAFRSAAGRKLKRPFRFVVSALRATGAETDGGGALYDYLLSMGHAPFQYPTPDGYPDDEAPWHGTLLWRWSFAAAFAGGRIPGTSIDLPRLAADLGGGEGLAAHLLGRRPRAPELAGAGAPERSLALTLASPAFQRC